jgi:predicted transcriptional regulator
MNNTLGQNWEEVEKELFSPEDITESDFRVAVIGELIKARNEKGLSQRDLASLSGVAQPVIVRIENGISCPNLETLIKLLSALGKTLAIVSNSKE